ncbi:MAG: sugar phosphate isomerase/epimerase [Verrucomicrobia bacterium]|nr:sugar phosphate isomerase/epimerase [Verrucomicrobiota bacterium]
MILMGISDEAGALMETQIRATHELGWNHIEARAVEVPGFPKGNIHDIPEEAFKQVEKQIKDSGVNVYCFGSTIGNWAKKITQPFEPTLEEVSRAIDRMTRLGTKYIRVMSFAIEPGNEQYEEERFRRMREITRRFLDAGITPVHENCMNYGGMSYKHALRLLENVPGLKWVFDTGNPIFNNDRSKEEPYPKQNAWAFYWQMKPYIEHIHIKDAYWDILKGEPVYTFPGEGKGYVKEILSDLKANGYNKGISIEPHIAVVFHDENVKASEEKQYRSYVEYGQKLNQIIKELK